MSKNFEGILNRKNKQQLHPSKQRIVEGLSLKRLQQNDSFHSSVIVTERNSSMRNSINSTLLHSDSSFANNLSQASFRTSRVSNHQESSLKNSINVLKMSQDKLPREEKIPSRKQTPVKASLPKINQQKSPITIEGVLRKYIDTNFIHSLMSFINKDWEEQEEILLKEKRFEALRNVITQKTNLLNMLSEEFITMQYDKYSDEERKLVSSLLFKQNKKVLNEYEGLFGEILQKIPEDKIVKQENQIQELYAKLCEIFDPKYINSNEKMKERVELFMQGYTSQKNNLLASIATKLKNNLDFISQMQRYLGLYQKQLIKIRNQLNAAEIQKNNLNNLLKKKVHFTPIQMDYERIQEIKQESKKQFFQDLEGNFIKFHENLHKKNNKNIQKQEKDNLSLKKQLEEAKEEIAKLKEKIYDMIHSVPKKVDASTQLFFVAEAKDSKTSGSSSMMMNFLSNVSTPFSFNEKVTGSLISLLTIDKILFDYQIIKNKHQLRYFPEFLIEWFLVRTGSKKVAQIFTKNFMYSVKELKNRHKRFNLFAKICGFNGFRKKNIQEDLQYIFFQTHKAWHYLIKIALIYRRRMNENPTGFHLFPPLACEGIFKLPLRKIYEVVEEFLTEEGIQIPPDLTNKIDYYAINQISKYKSHDEGFQKEQLQQIHILREINFDIIAGFIIEYIARDRCLVIQKLLRTITMKQKEIRDVLGYSEFEGIYRKYYKERRSKIQLIYSKICVLNQHDMLDIENAEPIIRAILEDETGMRNLFDENETLKMLIMTEKMNIQKSDKIATNPNSYENFRDRYYYEFYDFFNTTAFLEEIYRIIKSLIKKKLKQFIKDEEKLEQLTSQKQPLEYVAPEKEKNQEQASSSSSEDEYSDNQQDQPEKKSETKENKENKKQLNENVEKKKEYLEGKVEEWGKIIVRIPHFVQKILTIDQIIVHNMRRKEMIDASEFAWRTLRDLLIVISKN